MSKLYLVSALHLISFSFIEINDGISAFELQLSMFQTVLFSS